MFTLMYLGGLTMAASTLFPATASADRLQRCAREGGICRLPYPAEVVFGAQGRTTSRFFDRNAVPCTNRVFGDPAPGREKACYIVTRDRGGYNDDEDQPRRDSFVPCASEGDFCDFRGRAVVRYGARGRFTQDVFRNGVQCDNDTFGEDPAPGAQKRCFIQR
ncbi:MAG: hypothetical protein ABIQ51_20410 [Mesorhizobium sp.]